MDDKKYMIMLLKGLDRRITQVFEKRTDVSLTRYEILGFLAKNGHSTQKGLQQNLLIDQAAITRHLKLLEEQGYLTRTRNEKNNREMLVALTEEGQNLLSDSIGCKDQFLEDLYANFSDVELQQFKQYLTRLNENVAKL